MNRVTLLGRVGQSPEIKELANIKVAKFSLATSESYKKNGEKVTETTWHNLVFFGKQCDVIKTYVNKGDQLLVEGKIVVRKYDDKQGVTHWTTEIVCDRFELLSNKPEAKEPKEEVKKEEWHGKKEVKAMSNINQLPQSVKDAEEVPDDNMPF